MLKQRIGQSLLTGEYVVFVEDEQPRGEWVKTDQIVPALAQTANRFATLRRILGWKENADA